MIIIIIFRVPTTVKMRFQRVWKRVLVYNAPRELERASVGELLLYTSAEVSGYARLKHV